MSIPRNLSILADGANSSGVLATSKGGLNLTTLGTANQIVSVNSGGTALTYVTYSASVNNGGATNTPSASSNITLTSSSNRVQRIISTTGINVYLPDATTISTTGGPVFIVINAGANTLYIRDNATNVLVIMAPSQTAIFNLISNSSSAGTWSVMNGTVGATALSSPII